MSTMRAVTYPTPTRCEVCRNPLPVKKDGSPLRDAHYGPGQWCPLCGGVTYPKATVTLGCGHTAVQGSRADYLDRCYLCAAVAGTEARP